jgi:hypothetical protein
MIGSQYLPAMKNVFEVLERLYLMPGIIGYAG